MGRKSLIFLLIVVFTFSGCHSFRQKFIRKKKTEEVAPVYVSFKDYPDRPSRDAYIDYYLFVRGWVDELLGALNKGISFKRQKRAINEAIMNLEQIVSFYNHEGKELIYPLYEELLYFRKEIEKSPNMSITRRNGLIRKIEAWKRRFEKGFNYSDAEKWLS